MTENEIIEALECCRGDYSTDCDNCPNEKTCDEIDVVSSAIDLINRQRSEIERLQRKVLMLYPEGSPCSMQVEVSDRLEREIKHEAIKEFAERLKEKAMTKWDYADAVDVDDIDNLVKVMTEVENDEK